MQPSIPFRSKRISHKQRNAELDLIRCYGALASSEFYIYNETEAILHQENAIRLMKSLPDVNEELHAEKYVSLGLYLMENDQWDQAKEILKQAIEFLLQRNFPYDFIKMADSFALLCIIENRGDSSFKFNVRLKEFKRQIQKHFSIEWGFIEKVSRIRFTNGYSKKKPTKRKRVSKFVLMSLFCEYDKLTEYLILKREYVGAIKTVNRILELYTQFRKDDIQGKVMALFMLAKLNRLSLKEEECRQILAQIKQILDANKLDHISYTIKLFTELGLIEQQTGNQVEAKTIFFRALHLEKTNGGTKSLNLAHILYHLSDSDNNLKNYEDSRSHLEESLEVFDYHKSDIKTYIAIYQKLAVIELEIGNKEKSKDYILQGITKSEKVFRPDYKTIALMYKHLSKMEHKDGNEKKAMAYYYKFYENQVIKPTEFQKLFINYFRRGELLSRLGHMDYSHQYLEEALKLYRAHNLQDDKRLCSLYALMGIYHTKVRNFSKAILYLNRALKLRPCWDIAMYSLAQVYEKRNKNLDFRKEKVLLNHLLTLHQDEKVNARVQNRINELNLR